MDPHLKIHGTAAAGSGWWLLDELLAHGPSWSLVPPILIGLASLIGAFNAFRNSEQERRHKEVLFQKTQKLASVLPHVEGLDPRAN